LHVLCSELNWQVASGISAQQDRQFTLGTAIKCANRQSSEDLSAEIIDKLLDVVDWVTACRSYGLFRSRAASAKDGTQLANTLEPVSADRPVLPEDIWKDCLMMFNINLSVSVPIPSPSEGHVWHDLPHCYSERPQIVDVTANLSETLQSGTVLTAFTLPQFEGVVHHAASNSCHTVDGADETLLAQSTQVIDEPIDELAVSPPNTAGRTVSRGISSEPTLMPLTGTGESRPVPAQSDISRALAVLDQEEFVAGVGSVQIDTTVNGGLDFGQCIAAGGPTTSAPVADVKHEKAAGKGHDKGAVPSPTAADAVDAEAAFRSRYATPEWLTANPPRFILGDTVISMRCAATPIPELEHFSTTDETHGSKVSSTVLASPLQAQSSILFANMLDSRMHSKIPHFLCRVCICSVSDTARAVVVNSFRQSVLGVDVLYVEELILAAFANGSALMDQMLPQVSAHSFQKDGGKEKTQKQLLALSVYQTLIHGHAVSDEQQVCLLVQAISELPNAHPGFVIADFPNTKSQAVLLLQALSGINYDSHKPQPLDYATPFASPQPSDEIGWDTSLCGLDMAIFLDVGSETKLIEDRMSARSRVDNFTKKAGVESARLLPLGDMSPEDAAPLAASEEADLATVFLTQDNVAAGMLLVAEDLQELYTPARPVHSCAVEYSIAQTHQDGLTQFMRDTARIASIHTVTEKSLSVGAGGQLEATAVAIAESFAAKVMSAMAKDDVEMEVAEDDGDAEGLDDFLVQEGGAAVTQETVGSGDAVEAALLDGGAGMPQLLGEYNCHFIFVHGCRCKILSLIRLFTEVGSSSLELDVDEEEAAEAEAQARRHQQRLDLIAKCQSIQYDLSTPLPQLLAKSLADLWGKAEDQSNTAITTYFDSLR
jgi:hypothetical protein